MNKPLPQDFEKELISSIGQNEYHFFENSFLDIVPTSVRVNPNKDKKDPTPKKGLMLEAWDILSNIKSHTSDWIVISKKWTKKFSQATCTCGLDENTASSPTRDVYFSIDR